MVIFTISIMGHVKCKVFVKLMRRGANTETTKEILVSNQMATCDKKVFSSS